MVSRGGLSCRRCCFGFIICLCLLALYMWQLIPMEPNCYVGIFYVPALSQTLNTSSNSTIVFTVEFNKTNGENEIRYDNISITFGIFLDQSRTRPIGNSTIEGFYQVYETREIKPGSIEIDGRGLNRTAKVDGKTYFRVDFMTSVKYKILRWYTKRRSLWGGANVPVDDSGNMVGKKYIRLGHTVPVIVSGAPLLTGCYSMLLILGLFASFLFLSV